jgi:uncharacterized protein YdeI (YjbR/CyaY-like superfamily)
MPQENPETILVKSTNDFRKWLAKNHKAKSHVLVTRYKKHAQPDAPTHLELMHEAIAFGWIDTTAKRIDEDITGINFRKRGPNASWSNNTLSYARKLIKEGRMTPQGLAAYNLGKNKPTIDHGLPKDFPPQKDLIKALSKNKTALNNFNSLAPSAKFMYIVQIERAKLPETRKRRIAKTVEEMKSLKPKRKGKY